MRVALDGLGEFEVRLNWMEHINFDRQITTEYGGRLYLDRVNAGCSAIDTHNTFLAAGPGYHQGGGTVLNGVEYFIQANVQRQAGDWAVWWSGRRADGAGSWLTESARNKLNANAAAKAQLSAFVKDNEAALREEARSAFAQHILHQIDRTLKNLILIGQVLPLNPRLRFGDLLTDV
ncbi:hypothetical protein [Inquilinus sp. OTU3971]|uniref:hypothetical protein n=1 Tax=Inquilinus sp. OTU3971 TaxID=3043855 RepID=UPI00313CC358